MMGIEGFQFKKQLKAAIGKRPVFIETSMHGAEYDGDGVYTVVGPNPYFARKWYATVTVTDGVIARVT